MKLEFFDKDDQAKEGRGKDGDATFHREAWGTTPEKAAEDLKSMDEAEMGLLENQLDAFARVDATTAAKGYRRLLERFPEQARAAAWREKLAKLEDKK
jgi:hypothetical protein